MAGAKSLEYGWFFLRLGSGIMFLQYGASRFSTSTLELYPLATLLCGAALVLGLLVRPAVLLTLALMVSVLVKGSKIELTLIRDSLIQLLTLIGFLIGGGGSFLAVGSAISGLKGKWYQ
jgi:prepilin signal peptidase PulO-like enzyme (type II secretory pathway)